MNKSLCIILPAFNEARMIGKVILGLKKYCKKIKSIKSKIIVVDDGSLDQTAKIVEKLDITVIKHVINRGLGGALATGLTYAKKHDFDIALTFDSDGQHSFEDIYKAIKPVIEDRADVVIGSRLINHKDMPWDRFIIIFISNLITLLIFQIWTTDSQSGFRVFNKKALQLIDLKTQGMEVSSEFFGEIKRNKLRLAHVPIKVIYTDYSRQKGQSNLNSLNVGMKLLLRLFR